MRKYIENYLILSVIGLGNAVAVANAPPPYQPPSTILKDDIDYDVQADGTYTYDEIETWRVNNDQGIKYLSQLPLRFSTSLQELEIVEAYTTTRDGKRIDVDPDKILLQESPLSSDAPTFDDTKLKIIVFPALEVGATVTVHKRLMQKIPLFPKEFSMYEVFSKNREIKAAQVTLHAADSMKLFFDVIDLAGGEVKSDQPGRKTWRWHIENTQALAPQSGSVGSTDYSPRIAVTTFPNYESAATAYLSRATSQATVTPEIQTLADDITKGIPGKREQAEALYRWVSHNVRYVAIYFGFGGVVPHKANDIAQLKYGDCKDHVTLLESLLAAKGISSSPALVNASADYWRPEVVMMPGLFDHAITYIPEFHLFVDSTAGVADFGVLPLQERGKLALVTDNGSGKPQLMILPLTNAKDDLMNADTKLVLDSDGNLSGESKIENTGVFEMISRQIFSGIPKGVESQLASHYLTVTGQSGVGTFMFGDPKDLSTSFGFSTQFKLPNFAQIPGPGGMPVPLGVTSFSAIFGAFDGAKDEMHVFAAPIVSGRRHEVTTIMLPKNLTLTALPKPVRLDTRFGHYESSYSASGSILTVNRELDLEWPSATLEPEDYAAFRTMGVEVSRDLRAQAFYK